MISSTLFYADGSRALLVGLTESDLDEIATGLVRVIDLKEINLQEEGKLVISYCLDGIVMVPLDASKEDDVLITLDDEQAESLREQQGAYGYDRDDVPFRIILFCGDTDQDLMLFMEQTFVASGLSPRQDDPTSRHRPSLN